MQLPCSHFELPTLKMRVTIEMNHSGYNCMPIEDKKACAYVSVCALASELACELFCCITICTVCAPVFYKYE